MDDIEPFKLVDRLLIESMDRLEGYNRLLERPLGGHLGRLVARFRDEELRRIEALQETMWG